MSEWITPKECARRFGHTINTIYQWRRKGWIAADAVKYLPNDRMLIDFESIIHLKDRPRRRKRRRKDYVRPRIGVVRISEAEILARARSNSFVQDRPERAVGNQSTDSTVSGRGLPSGATEQSELQRLRVGHSGLPDKTGGAQTVGGSAGLDGRSGGTTAAAHEPTPERPARIAGGGSSDPGSEPVDGLPRSEERGVGEGPDVQRQDERRIRLALPGAEVYGSDNDSELTGDSDSADSDV